MYGLEEEIDYRVKATRLKTEVKELKVQVDNLNRDIRELNDGNMELNVRIKNLEGIIRTKNTAIDELNMLLDDRLKALAAATSVSSGYRQTYWQMVNDSLDIINELNTKLNIATTALTEIQKICR